jgi:hypothetical protein
MWLYELNAGVQQCSIGRMTMTLPKLCSSMLYLLWVALGAIIAFRTPLVLSVLPAWVWQLIIGVSAMGLAIMVAFMNLRSRSSEIEVIALLTCLLGVASFFLLGRSEKIFSSPVHWPLYLVGALIATNGLLLFIDDVARDDRSLADRIVGRPRKS